MPPFENYSLLEVLAELKKTGHSHTFTIAEGRAHVEETGDYFSPSALKIVGDYRIEGDSNPDDEVIVYAIASSNGVKGVIINSFGTNADRQIAAFISKIPK
jgi:hypothetical protein